MARSMKANEQSDAGKRPNPFSPGGMKRKVGAKLPGTKKFGVSLSKIMPTRRGM